MGDDEANLNGADASVPAELSSLELRSTPAYT